jgi:hypothetical protein
LRGEKKAGISGNLAGAPAESLLFTLKKKNWLFVTDSLTMFQSFPAALTSLLLLHSTIAFHNSMATNQPKSSRPAVPNTMEIIETRLAALDLALPPPGAPKANYVSESRAASDSECLYWMKMIKTLSPVLIFAATRSSRWRSIIP